MDVESTGERLANLSISEDCRRHDSTSSASSQSCFASGPSGGISLANQDKFNKLVMKAKQLGGEGRVREAVELNKKAYKIVESEKLAKRIAKMEVYLKEFGDGDKSEDDNEDNGMVHVGNGFYLFKDLYDKLYSHQKEGVLWLWGIHKKGKGGILGDDMGLGKTIQMISFLSGLFDTDKVKSVLVVLPVSLMAVWERELDKWAPGIRVNLYYGTNKRERERCLAKIQKRGGVCLTTYGLVVSSWEKLSQDDGREFTWDYIILDEGHKIKNPTKTSKGVRAIGARHRIIMTGTPIQNNLQELWALFDFVHHGSLLGTSRTFKMEYDTPITRARERDSTSGEKRLGMEMSESLKRIISPYFLRRTKAEVTAAKTEQDGDGNTTDNKKSIQMPSLTRKNDLIVWLFLTDAQKKIYEDFISLDDVKELLMTHKSPLVALTVLKKLCDHPRLLSTRACMKLGLTADDGLNEDDLETERGLQCAANRIQYIADSDLINESGKLIFLVELLDNLRSDGHRCLVFSQSTKMLNIIQKIITNRGHCVMRLDGSVIQISEREERINKFQNDKRYTVFLLTTQVGGVGLTLTSADRVVIFDPSWNPATDAQAVDRVFRIGQDKNVVIYRLITCATVEEKIYRRQIFKDSITRQTTGNSKNPYRYFTKQELKELFSLDDPHFSSTQKQLQEMHGSNRSSDTALDNHIAYLHSLDIFGISDHDLMFKVDQSIQDEGNKMDEGNDYIQSRVEKAQQLLHMENSLPSDVRAQMEKPARMSNPEAPKARPPTKQSFDPPPYKPSSPGPLKAEEVIDLSSPSPSPSAKQKQRQQHDKQDQEASIFENLSSDEQETSDSEDDVTGKSKKNPKEHTVDSGTPENALSKRSPAQTPNRDFSGNHTEDKENISNTVREEPKDSPTIQVNTPTTPSGVLSNLFSYVKNRFTPNSTSNTPNRHNFSCNVLNDSTDALNVYPDQHNVSVKLENTPKTLNQTPNRPNSSSNVLNVWTDALNAYPDQHNVSVKLENTPKTLNQTPNRPNSSCNVLNDSTTALNVYPTQNNMPVKLENTPKAFNQTPNRSFQRLIQEEIVVSPDPLRPIVKIEPKTPEDRQPVCPPRRFRHGSSDPIQFVLCDDPEPLQNLNPALLNPDSLTTIVIDSPDQSALPVQRPAGRNLSRLSVCHPRSFPVVMDSVENSPASGIESPNVHAIDETDEEDMEESSPSALNESNMSSQVEDTDSVINPSACSTLNVDTPNLEKGMVSASDQSSDENESPESNKSVSDIDKSSSMAIYPVQANSKPQKKTTVQSSSEDDSPQKPAKQSGKRQPSNVQKKAGSKKSLHKADRLSIPSKNQTDRRKSGTGSRKKSVKNRSEETESEESDKDVSKKNNKSKFKISRKIVESDSEESFESGDDVPSKRQIKKKTKSTRLVESEESDKDVSKKNNKSKFKISRKIVESDSEESFETGDDVPSKRQIKKKTKSTRLVESEESDESEDELRSKKTKKSKLKGPKKVSDSESTDVDESDEATSKKIRTKSSRQVESSEEEESEKAGNDEEEGESGSDAYKDSFIDDSDDGGDDDGSSASEGSEVSGDDDGDFSGSEEEGCEDEEMPIPEHLQEKYFELEAKAHHMYKKKKFKPALAAALEALEIYAEEHLQALALKLHQKLKK